MLVVNLRDGNIRQYKESEYTDYMYMKSVFVVIRDTQWIGIYNMQDVVSVECFNYK